jgi:UDP-N-acetylglucosamine pyrophosphorylase
MVGEGTMLEQVLQELELAKSAVNLNDLGRKLGVERSALEGMIAYLVRKGKLGSRASCPGPQGCPYVVKMPRTFSLTIQDSNLGSAES